MVSHVGVLLPDSFVILFRCGAVMRVFGMGIRTAVPVGVHDVVLGIAYVEFLGLFGVYLLDESGRYASPQLAVADDRILQDQGTGGYDGTMTDDSVVQNGGAHTDEGAAFHFATVQRDIMSYGHVVADDDGGFAVKRMQARTVLDVHAVADFDEMYVSAQDGVKPYGTVVAHGDVAYDSCPFGEVAVFAELGSQVVEFFNQCHIL